ncbi:MAG: hypothetical protein HY788_20800 [Deltaproteobacteria bacterium]|nr:hypothetical protein [Deltaproteobacteria bacterium]
MKKAMFHGWVFLVAVLMMGCGGGGGSDGSSNQDPSGPAGPILAIHSPDGVSLFYGEDLHLSVTGGSPKYFWSLRSSGDQTWSSFDESRTAPDGSSTYLVASDYLWGIGPTREVTIWVTDSAGNWGSLEITITDLFPTISPPKATVPLDIEPTPTMRFVGSGGTPPYFWTLDKPYLAQVVPDGSGKNLFVMPLAAGKLKITVFDSKNLAAAATLDIVAGEPKIVPNRVTLSLGESITLRANGGTPPYFDWHLSDPSVGVLSAPPGGWADNDEAVFTAFQLGTTEAIVDDDNDTQGYSTITVIQNRTMITPSEANLLPGEELILTANYGLPPYFFFNGDQSVGALEELSFNRVRFTAQNEGITVIRIEDSRGDEDTCRIMVSKAFQIYPLSQKGQKEDTIVFFLFGGTPPYEALVNNASVGSAVIRNGNEVHFTISANPAEEDTSYPEVVEVYDANGLRVFGEVVVAGTGCAFKTEPGTASGSAGNQLRYLVFCGVEPYQVTVMDTTLIDVASLSVSGNVITMTIASDAVEGTYSDVIRIVDANNQTLTAGVTILREPEMLAITPSSLSAAAGDLLTFLVTGGVPPYSAQVTNNSVASAAVNGNQVTVTVDPTAVAGTYTGLLVVYDSDSQLASATVIVN